jgi:hypothetical protein
VLKHATNHTQTRYPTYKKLNTMNYKMFNYVITIGLIISVIGFIFLKTNLLPENQTNIVHIIYKITLTFSIIFILTKSLFIKEKINQILKVIGIIFLLILSMNLLKEFSIYEIESIRIISYILFCSLLVMYISHFMKKENKKQLDYLKIGFVILLFVGGFLNVINVLPINLKYISGGLFWIVVIGMLYLNHEKENGMKKYVG